MVFNKLASSAILGTVALRSTVALPSQTARSLQTCDPSAWCVDFADATATLDGDANTPDVSLVYHASEPSQDGTYTKFYKVQILDESCSALVMDDAVTPVDAEGIVPFANFDASGPTLTVGLDLDVPNIEASSFSTPAGDNLIDIKFCVRIELLGGMGCTDDCTANTAIAVGLNKAIVTLSLDLAAEVGFQIMDFAAAPEVGVGFGGADTVTRIKGVNAKAQPISQQGNAHAFGKYFQMIRAALDNPDHLVEAAFHPMHGFPTWIRFQWGMPPGPDTISTFTFSAFKTKAGNEEELYNVHKALWNDQGLTSYDYTYSDLGANPQGVVYPVTVKVRNGVVTQAIDMNGVPLNFDSVPTPPTITEYIDEIGQQLYNIAPFMDIDYDATKGYPTNINMVPAAPTYWYKKIITSVQTENLSRDRYLQESSNVSRRFLQDYSQIDANQEAVGTDLTAAETTFAEQGFVNYNYQVVEECGTCDPEDYPQFIQTETMGEFSSFIVVNYPLKTFYCDDNNQEITDPPLYKPGQTVQFCVRCESPEARVIGLHSVQFENTLDPDFAIRIVDNEGEAAALSTMVCGGDICKVTTVAYARMFQKMEDGQLVNIHEGSKITGVSILQFVTSRRHLEEAEIDTTGSFSAEAPMGARSRKLEEGGLGGFDLDVTLATPPNGRRSASPTSLTFFSTVLAGIIGFLLI